MSRPPVSFDPDQESGPVPSPCRQICRLDAARHHCVGCLRTREEILNWTAMSDDARRAVWRELIVRRKAEPVTAP